MKHIIKNFLHSGHIFSAAEQAIQYKFIFLNNIVGFATLAVLFMSIVRYFQDNLFMAVFDISFAFVTIFLLYQMRLRKEKIEYFSSILLFLTYTLFTTLLVFAPTQSTRIAIFLLLIAAAFFLKGKTVGLYWLLITMETVSIIQFGGYVETGYSIVDIVSFFVYLTALYFVLNIYELIKRHKQTT